MTIRRYIEIVEGALHEAFDDDYDSRDPAHRAAAVQRTMTAVKSYAKKLGVRAEFREFGHVGEFELTDLYARTPGSGAGTKVMTLLAKLCDRYGLNVYAKPESPRNVKFYARFGFERSQRHFGMLVRFPPLDLDESAGVNHTVTLLDLYDQSELTDPREMLHNYAGPSSDWKKPMTVKTMTPEQAKTFRKAESDLTVVDAFKKHATKAQKALVREKAKNFDHARIIVVCDDMVVDGNHHLVAGVMAGQPIRYVDVTELG